MATLFNTKIKDTYQSLLKLEDNTIITTTVKNLTDGLGNPSPISLSSTVTSFSGRVGIGTNAPGTSLDVVGGSYLRGGMWTDEIRPYFGVQVKITGTTTWFNSGANGFGLSSPTAKIHILGSGSTSATTSLLVQNSSSSTSLVVNDAGNVLIGTSTDSGYKLNVNGSVSAGTNNGIFGDIMIDFGSGTRRIRPLANSLDLTDVFGNKAFQVNQSGNPRIALDQNGVDFVRGLNSMVYSQGANQVMTLSLGGQSVNHLTPFSDIVATGYAPSAPSGNNTTLRIYTTNTTSGVYGNIIIGHNGTNATGNIGIGTSTPSTKLYLDGGVYTHKYYTDNSNQTIRFGSGYEIFGTPHSSAGYNYYLNPTGWMVGWNLRIGDSTNYHEFSPANLNSPSITTSGLSLGSVLSYYRSSPDTGWLFASGGGWDFVIRGTSDEKLRIKGPTGNVLINTTTDAGYKLDVNGSLRAKGTGTTSATTSLLVQDSGSNNIFSVTDDGSVNLGRSGSGSIHSFYGSAGLIARLSGGTIELPQSISTIANQTVYWYTRNNNGQGVTFEHNNSQQSTSTGIAMVNIGGGYGTQASAQFSSLQIAPTYDLNANTSSTAIARGIYYNPTITNLRVAQHYAWQNTSGAMIVNSSTPNASAVLQADSTTQGFLPPRMTTAQKNAISSPATGLMVFDTDLVRPCFYNGATWVTL